MTIHSLTEYVKYRWIAKSRHGIHSPFVYTFIERVLMNKDTPPIGNNPALQLITYQQDTLPIHKQLLPRYHRLLQKIASVYNFTTLLPIATDNEEEPLTCDFLLLTAQPKVWIRLFNRHLPTLKTNSCIMVAHIHKTRRHTGKWNRLCNHPKVKLSIDLYGVGLLFFKEDFKEKQHFVLKKQNV